MVGARVPRRGVLKRDRTASGGRSAILVHRIEGLDAGHGIHRRDRVPAGDAPHLRGHRQRVSREERRKEPGDRGIAGAGGGHDRFHGVGGNEQRIDRACLPRPAAIIVAPTDSTAGGQAIPQRDRAGVVQTPTAGGVPPEQEPAAAKLYRDHRRAHRNQLSGEGVSVVGRKRRRTAAGSLAFREPRGVEHQTELLHAGKTEIGQRHRRGKDRSPRRRCRLSLRIGQREVNAHRHAAVPRGGEEIPQRRRTGAEHRRHRRGIAEMHDSRGVPAQVEPVQPRNQVPNREGVIGTRVVKKDAIQSGNREDDRIGGPQRRILPKRRLHRPARRRQLIAEHPGQRIRADAPDKPHLEPHPRQTQSGVRYRPAGGDREPGGVDQRPGAHELGGGAHGMVSAQPRGEVDAYVSGDDRIHDRDCVRRIGSRQACFCILLHVFA